MSQVLTRVDLIQMLMTKFKLSKIEASDMLKEVVFSICSALRDNEVLKLSSFGSFVTNNRKSRVSINPKTKQENLISERRIIKFRASDKLKNDINNNTDKDCAFS
jgi:integration host factor subunit alpha